MFSRVLSAGFKQTAAKPAELRQLIKQLVSLSLT